MAESYIVTIKFTPSNNSLRETENRLMKVFNRVTNGFKNGFAKAWKGLKIGSGIMGMATALTALLNPLSALNDRINATLTKAGSIKDRAAGAGTDIKTYLALQGYAASKNISEETLSSAISRMQVLIGDAKAGNENALSNYADETDMGKVFYNVMNQISKIADPAERAKMASDIFGTRAVSQLGPLVTEGFDRQDFSKLLQGVDLNKAQSAVLNLDERGKEQAVLQYKREINDMINKSKAITPDVIRQQDQNARASLKLEDKQLAAYSSLSGVENTVLEIKAMLGDLYGLLEPVLPVIKKSVEGLSMIPQAIEDTKYMIGQIRDKLPRWLGGSK